MTCRIFLVEHTCSWTSWWSSGPVVKTPCSHGREHRFNPIWDGTCHCGPGGKKKKKGIFVLLDSCFVQGKVTAHILPPNFPFIYLFISTQIHGSLFYSRGYDLLPSFLTLMLKTSRFDPWEPFKLALCPSTCSHHFFSISLLSDPQNVPRSSCIFPVPQLLESVIFSREKRVYF